MILFYYNNKPETKAYQLKYSLPLSNLFFYHFRLLKIPFFPLFGIELVELEVAQKDDINHLCIFNYMSNMYFLVKKIISTLKH